MNKNILILTFLLSVQIILGQDLKIATFNCEFLIKRKVHIKYGLPYSMKYANEQEIKKWNDDKYREQKFIEATDRVAEQIHKINADIIGLTEVGNEEEVKALAAAIKAKGTEYKFIKVCKSSDSATGQHVAFLSKIKLLDIVSSFPDRGMYFVESDKDETVATGISKGMKVTINVKGENIHLFLFHLKSERGGEDSDQKRLMQAEIARRLMIPFIQKKEHVIVMGDLNSEKRHPVLQTIRGFLDIQEEMIQTGDSYYFEEYDTRWTYDYKGQREQIDHILLSLSMKEICKNNNPKQKKWGIKTSITETGDELISDHNALIVELNFK
jgi:predicted extracellular nuclease